MPGRMESVENLSRQQYRVRGAVDGFPPFPPPLGNRYAIPTVPQPRRRRYLSYEQETQGDTSIELPRGTFLLGVDSRAKPLWNFPTAYATLSRGRGKPRWSVRESRLPRSRDPADLDDTGLLAILGGRCHSDSAVPHRPLGLHPGYSGHRQSDAIPCPARKSLRDLCNLFLPGRGFDVQNRSHHEGPNRGRAPTPGRYRPATHQRCQRRKLCDQLP